MLALTLCACQDTGARRENAALTERVTKLEAQVVALKAQQAHALTVTQATQATTQAAAQNCAVELSRTLETYRQNSLEHRYPTPAEFMPPDACTDLDLSWQRREPRRYALSILGADGEVLARQDGP